MNRALKLKPDTKLGGPLAGIANRDVRIAVPMNWLSENYKWVFDGIGVALLIAGGGFLIRHFAGFWHRLREHRLAWPKGKAPYIAASSDAIPPFPDMLTGFRPAGEDKDFWDKPFPAKGSVRVFAGAGWQGIPDFPKTMNGCSHGVFMIRWRSADSAVLVRSSVRYSTESKRHEKAGAFGYMSGTNCEQPMFRFRNADNGATLVDVFYELKFWQAAP